MIGTPAFLIPTRESPLPGAAAQRRMRAGRAPLLITCPSYTGPPPATVARV